MKTKLILFWIALVFSKTLFSQTTETFELVPNAATSFTTGLSTFNLTSNATNFYVFPLTGLGYNNSSKFIHVNDGYGQIARITKSTGTFKINSFWFYVTGNASQSPGVPSSGTGAVTFRGKLAGATKFTVLKESGFTTSSASPANGFGLIDFATEGGANNTGIEIDQLEIELNNRFDYFAIDNFTFSLPVLPVNLTSFNAKLVPAGNVELQWQTTSEQNNKGFVIYRSGDDKQFAKIGEISAAFGNQLSTINYSYIDKQPLNGNNYYKLVQLDNDGTEAELGVKLVAFSFQNSTFNVYPNPTYNKVDVAFIKGKYNLLILSSANGKVLQKIALQPNEVNVTLDLSAYAKGVYFVKLLGDDDSITHKVMKQ